MVGLPKYTPEQRQFIYHLKKTGYSARRIVQAFNERWKGGVKGKPLSIAGVAYVCANKDHPDLKVSLHPKFKSMAGPSRTTQYQQPWVPENWQPRNAVNQHLQQPGENSLWKLRAEAASEQWMKECVDLTGT